MHVCSVARLCPILCNPMDCACQASLSMGCPRQEYWSRSPFPTPGNLPNPEIELTSAAVAGGFFTTGSPGKPLNKGCCCCSVAQLCSTLCDPMDCSMPGYPVHHHLLESAQTYVLESVMPSNYLILCCHLLLPPSIFPSITIFSKESVVCIRWPKYWSFSFNISPSSEYSGLISFRID